MIIDIIIVVLLLLGISNGYKKGVVRQLFNIISIIIGYIVSFLLSSRLAFLLAQFLPTNKVADQFSSTLSGLNISEGYYQVISFFLIFFLVQFVIRVIGNTLGLVTKLPVIKSANKLLGGIFGFLEVYLVLFVCIYCVYVLPISPNFHNMLVSEATIPNFIFEQTPILSKMLLEEFFNYIK